MKRTCFSAIAAAGIRAALVSILLLPALVRGSVVGHAFVGVADKVTSHYEHITCISRAACNTLLFGDRDGSTHAVTPRCLTQARGLPCIDPSSWDADGRVQALAPTVGPHTRSAGGTVVAPAAPATNAFLIGADISWVPQQEAGGRRFSENGHPGDVLAILKQHGFNAIRLRLFVDPAAPEGYSAKGFCGQEATLVMAERIKTAGMKLLLDLHYSDTWADPAHQRKPAAWRDLDFAALTNRVHDYTRDTLAAFTRRGLTPDIVQVGNEISAGLLWPDGRVSDFDKLAALLGAGIRGVREAAPSAQVMLHLALGGQNDPSRWFLDNALRRGLAFDLIGQSYYPRWHGTLDDLRANLTDLASRYRQGLVVVEYSAPDGPQINALLRSLPSGKGGGSFIWEPTHPGHGKLFERNGAALPALQEYR